MNEAVGVVPLLGKHVRYNIELVHPLLSARWVSVLDQLCLVSKMLGFQSMASTIELLLVDLGHVTELEYHHMHSKAVLLPLDPKELLVQ